MGVLVDQRVFQALIRLRLPKLGKLMEQNPEMRQAIDQRSIKWIICLFVNELPMQCEYLIWDLFFVAGCRVLFRFALTILSLA